MTTTTTLAIPTTSQVLNLTATVASDFTNATKTLVKTFVNNDTSENPTKVPITTTTTIILTSPKKYDSGYMESRIIFLFCTVLLIVATMLIIKIVTSNKRK